jgi:hypothetical protein
MARFAPVEVISKNLAIQKKGKQIWPAETRPAVPVLGLRSVELNCARLRSGPEQELKICHYPQDLTFCRTRSAPNLQKRCYTNLLLFDV